MSAINQVDHAAGLAYREVVPAGEPRGVVMSVHGWPQSSYSWRPLLAAVGEAGWRGVAPDLLGFGDSPADPPHTWERQVEALERLHGALGLGPVVLVVHDWGGLIGLRWACDHPGRVRAMVISDTGFFPNGRWHGLANSLRTEGEGEQVMEGLTAEGFAALLGQASRGIDRDAAAEYFKAFADPERRRGTLELYRSGDFSKLEPYEGRLAELGVPALLLWGEDDPFAPVAGAHRFARELPDARVEVVPGTGHFLYDDEPDATAAAVVRFLGELS
ncbi:MAG TPA: alpha/beta fold hydrolase [Solirubrobacteraceae bacterium]|jgi:haloalkane dehalogenase|nr:alpha/beta fold hydrolase [Solirubrobacteraceae bacterium]